MAITQRPILFQSFSKTEQLTQRINKLEQKLTDMHRIINGVASFPDPWIDLKRACHMKGISYKTLTNPAYRWRRPRGGEPDAILNNRAYWRPETIREWILLGDDELAKRYKPKQ